MYSESFSQRIDRAFAASDGLAKSHLAPSAFFCQMVFVIVDGIEAVAGTVWQMAAAGNIELRGQHNVSNVQLDRSEMNRQQHNELLEYAFQLCRPILMEPRANWEASKGRRVHNPSDFYCLLTPIEVGQELFGLLEVWTNPDHDVRIQRTCLNYCVQMTRYIGDYVSRQSDCGRP